MTITDETTRDIVKFIKGFAPNSCCCCDDVTFSLYGETEESTKGLSVKMKKNQNNPFYFTIFSLLYVFTFDR